MTIIQEPEFNNIESGSSINIRVQNLTKSFSGTIALDNINLEFNSGEIHGLVGQNGAGKSTLGKIIGGHYKSTSGDIYICLLYTSPSPRDRQKSRMPSSA